MDFSGHGWFCLALPKSWKITISGLFLLTYLLSKINLKYLKKLILRNIPLVLLVKIRYLVGQSHFFKCFTPKANITKKLWKSELNEPIQLGSNSSQSGKLWIYIFFVSNVLAPFWGFLCPLSFPKLRYSHLWYIERSLILADFWQFSWNTTLESP